MPRLPKSNGQSGEKCVSIDSGNRAAVLEKRDTLVESHRDMVRSIAISVKRKLPSSFELDDLMSAGYIGLVNAATRYRPTYRTPGKEAKLASMPFAAYARPKIHGAIVDSVRRRHYEENTRPSIAGDQAAPNVIETEIDDGRLTRKINAAVALLPLKLQAIVEMHYHQELELKEIAEQLRINRNRIAVIHREAITELRKLLA